MKNRFYLLLLILLAANTLSAKDKGFFIQTNKPQWTETIGYEYNTKAMGMAEDAANYLLVDYQQNVSAKEYYVHIALVVNNETGIQNNSDIWVDYDPSYQKLMFHQLIVHRKGKDNNRLKRSDFKIIQNEANLENKIYSGRHSAGIYIEDVQVGDIIEFAYTIKGTNPVFQNNYFDSYNLQFQFPISKYLLKIIYPQSQDVHYKLIEADHKPTKLVSGSNIILKWELDDIEQVILNSELPTWFIAYEMVQLSSMKDWSELINWGVKLYPKVNIAGTELGQKAKELTAHLKTETEKIEAMLHFVQEDIRYVGIEVNENGYRPYHPADIYSKRYGDCKDKTYLLITLLNHIGIKAYPVWVSTYYKQYILDYLPSPTVFNHVITAIQHDGELIYVDPTLSNQNGDFKVFYNGNYVKGLLLNDQNNSPIDIINSSLEKIVITETYDVIDTISPVQYSVSSTYYGGEADRVRAMFKGATKKELRSMYLNAYSYLHPSMEMTQDLEQIENIYDNIFQVKENYLIHNFWQYDKSVEQDYVCEIAANNLWEFISDPVQKNRTMPFFVYYPVEIEHTINFNHISEIAIEIEQGEIRNANFEFTYSISQEGNALKLYYNYKPLKDHVSVFEMEQYFKDVGKVSDLMSYALTYGASKSGAASNINWLLIILSVFVAVILIFIVSKLYKKDLASDIIYREGIPIGGWLVLVGIGIIVTPFYMIYSISLNEFFNLESWEFISSPKSEGYNALWSIAFVLELMMNVVFVVYLIFLIILFFKRRSTFPIHYISFKIINLVLIVTDYYLLLQIESDYLVADDSAIKAVVKVFIGAAIWIPYMLFSERVKDTFTKTHKTLEVNNKEED